MPRSLQTAGTILGLLLLGGCVERRYTVCSDPPGAIVHADGVPLGATPVDAQFVYYGKYHFTLIKDGYETLHVEQEIRKPVYQYFPLDAASEILWPCHIQDNRQFFYRLTPLQLPAPEQVLDEANQLRERARMLPGDPPKAPTTTLPPVPQLQPPKVPSPETTG